MTAIEGYLYNLEKDKAEHLTAFRCANCHYYETMTTDLGIPQPYCHRRERAIGWNPERFYCTEYGAGDSLDEWEERIFPKEALTYTPPAPPTFSDFIEAGAPRIVNPVQTNLDRWFA